MSNVRRRKPRLPFMEHTGDVIAEKVLTQFESLPAKRKPHSRVNGLREWVPLCGVIAEGRDGLKCVALGTGMKCLTQNKISHARGVVLHDWHAEIVAIRSFNLFLLRECQALASSQKQSSHYLRRRRRSEITSAHFQPFAINEDISLHMYCSEAPCGDASMELTMAAQVDDTPWNLFPESLNRDTSIATDLEMSLKGRGYFSELGIVRKKPSRPDAPPTLSKSCSDKLALKQCTSLLSSLISLLISPENAYFKSLTLPESQYSVSGCERAFGPHGRMMPLQNQRWDGGYKYFPFLIRTTKSEFRFSRRSSSSTPEKLVPSNLATAWTPYGEETLIGGVLQGRKQFDTRGASMICKQNMWKLALDIAVIISVPTICQTLNSDSYERVKKSGFLNLRRIVHEEVKGKALQGWIPNGGDDFRLEFA